MADKPVLKLPVDSEDFDALLKKIQEFKGIINELPEEWAEQNAGVEHLKDNFEETANQLAKMKQTANDSKLTGGSSFISKFEKSSDKAEKSWAKTTRWIEKSEKNLSGIARLAIVSGARGGLFGAVAGGGLVGAVVGGTALAANTLADQNAQMRALGLKPGEEAAFTTEYEKFGGDDSTLEKAAEAKRNPKVAAGLGYLGFSSQEIANVPNMDVSDIAKLMLQRGGESYNKFGGVWASQGAVSKFFNPDQLQRAGSYDSKAYADANKEFQELIPKLALQQRAYDEGTEALRKFNEALKEDEMTLLTAFEPLLGPVSTLTKEFSDAVAAFAKSGELTDDINDTITAFKDVSGVVVGLKDELNKLFGLDNKSQGDTGTPMYSAPAGSVGANVVQFGGNLWKLMQGKKLDDGSSPAVNWNPFGRHADGNSAGGGSTDANIGNMKNAGGKGFQSFESKAAGAKAMARQLVTYQDRDHLDTLSSIINKWAPASDHNDDAAYIKDVSQRTGFAANQKIDLHDPKVLAAVEAAMASHEKGVAYSPADIDAMLSAKPQAATTTKDMTAKQARAYAATMQTYVSPVMADMQGGPNKVDLGMTDHILGEIAATMRHMDQTVSGLFREGGGSQFRTPDAPRTPNRSSMPSGYTPTPKITISNQTGANMNVISGSLAQ